MRNCAARRLRKEAEGIVMAGVLSFCLVSGLGDGVGAVLLLSLCSRLLAAGWDEKQDDGMLAVIQDRKTSWRNSSSSADWSSYTISDQRRQTSREHGTRRNETRGRAGINTSLLPFHLLCRSRHGALLA